MSQPLRSPEDPGPCPPGEPAPLLAPLCRFATRSGPLATSSLSLLYHFLVLFPLRKGSLSL